MFSLFELHSTVYGEHADDAVTLRLQDRDGQWIAEIVLTPDECRRWLEQLLSAA